MNDRPWIAPMLLQIHNDSFRSSRYSTEQSILFARRISSSVSDFANGPVFQIRQRQTYQSTLLEHSCDLFAFALLFGFKTASKAPKISTASRVMSPYSSLISMSLLPRGDSSITVFIMALFLIFWLCVDNESTSKQTMGRVGTEAPSYRNTGRDLWSSY